MIASLFTYRKPIFFIFFFSLLKIQAQDTLTILTEAQFLDLVRSNHPVAKQASLLVDEAKARLLAVRGNFDPVISVDNDRKVFNQKDYFNYFNAELVVPTWMGVELYGGIEDNTGDFINTERTTNQSSYAGISVPLLKDLVLDQRRAVLQQAKLFSLQSLAERRLQINDLLLEASLSYMEWARDHYLLQILDTTIRLNEERYQLVLNAYKQGDRAAMDTSEALAQLQSFEQMREEARLNYQKSSLYLSNYLWSENNKPLFLKTSTLPDIAWVNLASTAPNLFSLDQWVNTTLGQHPKIAVIDYKIQALKVERELKFQSLLPKADLKYNFLQRGYDMWGGLGGPFMENNYKFGFNISVPIPNRGGFGAYRAARIKIKAAELDRENIRWQLENKVRYQYNEVFNLSRQVDIFSKAYFNYIALLNAEKLKFSLGETTLFILNARENKALETLQKLIAIKAKYLQSFAKLSWAGGQLN